MTCERLIAQRPQIAVHGARYPEYLQKLVGRCDEQRREPGRLDLFLKDSEARLMLTCLERSTREIDERTPPPLELRPRESLYDLAAHVPISLRDHQARTHTGER